MCFQKRGNLFHLIFWSLIRYDERLVLQHFRHQVYCNRQFQNLNLNFFQEEKRKHKSTESENLKEKDNVETNRACVDIHDIDNILNVNTIV